MQAHSPRWIACAALGPIAIGGIVSLRAATPTPLAAVPGIIFGVLAVTAPALYISTAATGTAPPVAAVARSLLVALGAFGVALLGFALPAAFLSLSVTSVRTTLAITTLALAAGGYLAMRRLDTELVERAGRRTTGGTVVFACWAIATLGIAARLWTDFASEVLS